MQPSTTVTTIMREVNEIGFSAFQLYNDTFKEPYTDIFDLTVKPENMPKNRKGIDILELAFTELKDLGKVADYRFESEYLGFAKPDGQNTFLKVLEDHKSIIVLSESQYNTNFYCIGQKSSREFLKKIIDLVKKEINTKVTEASEINIICNAKGRFYTEAYPITFSDDSLPLEDCYNDELLDVDRVVVEKLRMKKSKGVVLFHGSVGSGKTTYLRRLITRLDKKVIYLPPELAHDISSPNFVTFLMENPDSILMIEDAENVLKTRAAGGNQAISNLLNITDGILSDALHLQVVCTFNCPRDDIDSALLRPGRLIAEYKFEELSEIKTVALLNKLYTKEQLKEVPDKIKKKMTVAQIFNLVEEMPITIVKKQSFGFTPTASAA